MFSYCKKGKTITTKQSSAPFEYRTSQLNTLSNCGGFSRDPSLCQNLYQPYVQNRGIPRDLIFLETTLQGRDKSVQPFCGNAESTDNEIQFSTFREMPIIPRGAPPQINVNVYGGNGCNHVGRQQLCGYNCNCPERCSCKEQWKGSNVSRPMAGQLGVTPLNDCVYKF